MLALVSDLHLSDGTASSNVHPKAFDLLAAEIQHSARQNGATELHLVLLGDCFDLVRTDWWFDHTSPDSRPWNGQIDPQTGMNAHRAEVERQFAAVLTRLLDHPSAQGFFQAVRRLARARSLPALRVTCVPGNHDRVLNNFPALRQAVQARFGDVPVAFQNSLCDPAYAVCARHGHEWDDDCNARLLLQEVLQKKIRWDPLDEHIHHVMNLGEVITAELMSGLVWRIRQTGDQRLAAIVKDADLLRPMVHVFEYLDWQTRTNRLSENQKQLLARLMIEALSGVVDSEYGRLWDQVATDFLVRGDTVDRLQLARWRLQTAGYDGLRDCVKLFSSLQRAREAMLPLTDACYGGAKTEFARCGPEIQYLLYGHTHHARHDYLTGSTDGRVQMYINTGTFLPLLQRTDDGRGFAKSSQMTLAFFYREDEDRAGRAGPGPTLDLWNGVKRKEYAQPA